MQSSQRQEPGQRMAAVFRARTPLAKGGEKGDGHRELRQVGLTSSLGWEGKGGRGRGQEAPPQSLAWVLG